MKRGQARTAGRPRSIVGSAGLAAAERRLLQVVDAAFSDAARRAGDWLACEAGCADCCHEPFPVTRFDGRLLRHGMAELRERDPGRASAIERRAREAVTAFSEGYPGDRATGRLNQDVEALDGFLAGHGRSACPVLDPGSLTCELYEHRPVPCRTFGPPLRYGNEDAPHCALCFRGASPEIIERCRVEPDPAGLEHAITRAAGAPGDESWDTLIAFALIRE